MSFKKFISGVSAIAIAASAFAAMAVTANAAVISSQDYESAASADWTTGTSGRYTPIIVDTGSNKFLSVDQDTRYNNGATITSSDFNVTAETDYTLTFDAIVCAGNNNAASFTINGADGKAIVSMTATASAATWAVNGALSANIGYVYGKGTTNDNLNSYTWHSYKLTVYEGNVYFSIDGSEETPTLAVSTLPSVASTGGLKTMVFASGRYYSNFAIDNVVVSDVDVANDVPSTPQAEFSVVYKTTEDVTLEKTASGTGDVDSVPVLLLTDKVSFVENGQKYIYVSDNSAEQTIADDNSTVVTVTVRAAASYNVTVAGSEGTVFKSESVFEGDSISASYPKYITDENKKVTYETALTSYTKTIAPVAETNDVIPYTAYEGTAYFVDHETITRTSKLESGNYSNGSASRAVNDGVAAFTVAEAGTYDITVAASCRSTTKNSVFAVYKNSVDEANLLFNDDVIGASQNTVQTTGTRTITGVELAAGDVVIIQGDNGQTWIDYVLAVKATRITVNIGTAAPVTLESDYDMSGVVVVGYYDSNNKFLRAETYTAQSVINAPALGEGENAIVFWWSDITGNITPVCEAVAVGAAASVE